MGGDRGAGESAEEAAPREDPIEEERLSLLQLIYKKCSTHFQWLCNNTVLHLLISTLIFSLNACLLSHYYYSALSKSSVWSMVDVSMGLAVL